MFDWKVELAAPVSPLLVHSRLLVAQNVTLSALSVPVPAQAVALPPAALGGTRISSSEEAPYSVPCIKGDALSIKIGKEEYSKGLAECQYALRGRLTLNKGDKPYTACDLTTKLGKV